MFRKINKCLEKNHRKAKTENSCWQSSKSSQEYIAPFTLYLFVYLCILTYYLGIILSTQSFSLFILCHMKITLHVHTQSHHILWLNCKHLIRKQRIPKVLRSHCWLEYFWIFMDINHFESKPTMSLQCKSPSRFQKKKDISKFVYWCSMMAIICITHIFSLDI